MVRDVFFDDEHWMVRYFVVNTSSWLVGRKVLILPHSLRGIDNFNRTLAVDLTREQIKKSPDIDTHQPMSRAQELRYHRYFGFPIYWGGIAGEASVPIPAIPEPQYPPKEDVPGESEESHLRSARELEGYHVEANDGPMGHVTELLIAPEDWRIAYLVLKTKDWLPGKTVVVPTHSFRNVNWFDRTIKVALDRSEIEAAPEFNLPDLENGMLAEKLQHHFGAYHRS
ncbi:MAG: PRC-barrel domain-containing protein [Nibricoccus sp.]